MTSARETANHTPTPWTVTGRELKPAFAGQPKNTLAISSPGHAIALALVYADHAHKPGTGEANADFIVRACNSHDALLAFARRVAREPIGPADATAQDVLNQLAAEAQQLIAQAESH